ncbi:outer membrane beta-barrel protein [Chryseosolibacter indicus]|uniref:Outer membrane beta-barrel protein n=1 Tax=Chryseosolibacter indicus TaxID=2782351 RepID=A0ABS5VUV7_9BACT|nr:outer membrane beta-barrel protein [Chryseosolibacter indicus]MBT1705204.1 outer membrane beta-barrel protein [Chryseosolibacter indicus]
MKRLYFVVLCLLMITGLNAQHRNKRPKLSFNKSGKEKDIFLKKQWWVGLKGGPNLSKAVVEQTYSVVAPTNYELSEITKQYKHYKNLGGQATLDITFYFRGFSASFQPTYRHSRFEYTNNYEWTSAAEGSRLFQMKYTQLQKIDYLDLPLVAKYEFGIDRIRPFIQAGLYTTKLLNANKIVEVTKTDFASGGVNEIVDDPIIVGATDLFAKNHWGFIAGAGLNYNLGNVRLNLDFQYKYGMSNIASTKNRQGNDRLAGVGDSLDNIKLNTIAISVGCLFPMRFLESGFKSLDKK